MDLDLPLGRVELEEFAVVGQPDVGMLRQAVEHVGQRHVAVGMMMAVRLAVGGDVHELGVLAAIVEALEEPIEEPLAVVEQPLEGDVVRDDAVVEEQDDRPARGEPAEIGPRRVDPAGDLLPALRAQLPPPPRLPRRQDREPDARLGQHLERLDVDGRLGQPHPFGSRPKRWRKSAIAPGTCVSLSCRLASGMMT